MLSIFLLGFYIYKKIYVLMERNAFLLWGFSILSKNTSVYIHFKAESIGLCIKILKLFKLKKNNISVLQTSGTDFEIPI